MEYNLGIDVRTKDGNKLIKRLAKLKATVSVTGPFPYHEDQTYAQILLTTTKTENEVDDWLYKVKHGCEYVGVFSIEDSTPLKNMV